MRKFNVLAFADSLIEVILWLVTLFISFEAYNLVLMPWSKIANADELRKIGALILCD